MSSWMTGILLSALFVAGVGTGWSQEALRTKAKGFRHAEPHPRPNEGQTKYLLQGGETVPLENNRLLIREPMLQVFRVDGQREFMMQAPECVFDMKQRVVASDGSIAVVLAGDRFNIGGRGYRIEADRSFLVISNDVKALVRDAESNGVAESRPLEIRSERFEFDATNRHGIFFGPVRGEDDEIRFACDRLSARATGGNGTFDLIEAEGNVVIESRTGAEGATAQHAVYRQTNDVVALEREVTWKRGRHEGRADRLLVRRSDRSVEADGSVAMKLPRESLSLGGIFLGGTNRLAAPVDASEEAGLVDLKCDRFLSSSNWTEAIGRVRIVDGTNRLFCESIKAFDDLTNNVGRVVLAEGSVSVEQGENAIRSERAQFTESNSIVLFTGQPHWNLARTRGKARRVTMNAAQGNVFADGDVEVQVPIGGEEGSFLKLFPGDEERLQSGERMVMVFAREFDADEERVTFLGNVRAHEAPMTGHEPRLRSNRLEVTFGAEGRQFESIAAKENVVFEQGTPGVTNGPAVYRRLASDVLTARALETGQLAEVVADGNVEVRQPGSVARGARADYDGLTDVLRLSGKPTLSTPQADITEAKVLIYDRANERFTVTQPFEIKLKQGAGRGIVQKLGAPQ